MVACEVKKMDVFTNGEWLDRRKDSRPDIWIEDWMYNFVLHYSMLPCLFSHYCI